MEPNNEPYVGPRPFEENDRTVFFGRSHEANELVSLITAHSVVLLYAQSGAGKTSLVKAGLIPLLTDEEGFDVLPPMRVREQTAVSAASAEIENIYMFNALMATTHSKDDLSGLESDWKSLARTSLRDFLRQRTHAAGRAAPSRPTIVVFDQFEELFTLYPEHWEERQKFFEQIRDALAEDSLLRVLFSMREDFIAELDPYAFCLPEKIRTRFRIERLTRRTGLLAITQPLEAINLSNGGVRFAPGIEKELIDNLLMVRVKTPQGIQKVTGKFIEPLQLQVVCQTLWNNLARGDKLITRKHLDAFGDVDKALSVFYETAIERVATQADIKPGALRRWCEQSLITPGGTRGTAFRGEHETVGLKNQAVDELERQSLIRMELRGGAQWYELAHDRFIEIIQDSNRKWSLALPGAQQILLRLEDRAAEWVQNDREESRLLDQVELFEAERWLTSSELVELEPSKELLALVKESRRAFEIKEQQELEHQGIIEQQARTSRIFRWLSVAMTVLFIISIAVSIKGYSLWRQSQALLSQKVQEQERRQNTQNALNKTQLEVGTARDIITRKQSQNEAMLKAESLLSANQLTDARDAFERLVKDFPEQDPTYALLEIGEVFQRQQQYLKAIDYYDQALAKWCDPIPPAKIHNLCIDAAKSPPDGKDPLFRNYVAATINREASVFIDFGQYFENNGDVQKAQKKYSIAAGYYNVAMQLFNRTEEGFAEAREGLKMAKAATGRLQTTPNSEPSDEP